MNQNLTILRRSVSRLLAAALLEIDPSLLLVQGGELMAGFYYDFIPSHEVSLPFLQLVEEKMRSLVKEGKAVEKMEMVPSNAKEYLEHLGHHLFSEEEEWEGKKTVTLFRLGDFADICPAPFLKNTREMAHFHLCSLERIGKRVFRLIGSAQSGEKEVKEECKRLLRYPKRNHLTYGESHQLFYQKKEGFFWLRAGVAAKEKLLDFWKREVAKQNFCLVETPKGNWEDKRRFYKDIFEREGKKIPLRLAEICPREMPDKTPILFEGLLEPLFGHQLVEVTFLSQKELLNEVISSLQFIDKILNIFNFSSNIAWNFSSYRGRDFLAESEIFVQALEKLKICFQREETKKKETCITVAIEDGLGRMWPGPYLSVHKVDKDVCMVERSLFGVLERWMALSMEKASEFSSSLFGREEREGKK